MKKFIFRRINGRIIPILNKGTTTFAAKTSLNSLSNRAWRETKTGLIADIGKKTPDTIKVHTIRVVSTFRNQGIGTSIMKKLGKIADKYKKQIVLTAGGMEDGMSTPRLKKFYRRFGFVANKGRNKDFRFTESMIRKVKK